MFFQSYLHHLNEPFVVWVSQKTFAVLVYGLSESGFVQLGTDQTDVALLKCKPDTTLWYWRVIEMLDCIFRTVLIL